MQVPDTVEASDRRELTDWRNALLGEASDLTKRIATHDAKCRAVDPRNTGLVAECEGELGDLHQAYDGYLKALAEYSNSIKQSLARAAQPGPEVHPAPLPYRSPAIVAPVAGTAFPPRAAELVAALNTISAMKIYEGEALPRRKPVGPTLLDKNCQTFFRALGTELARRGQPSWDHEFPEDQLGRVHADGIFRAIAAEAKAGGRWRELTPEAAQVAANQGQVVIGGVPMNLEKGRTHGHLAVVVPLPPGMKLREFQKEHAGSGPFVRDGNEHLYTPDDAPERYELSTWGAIPASRMMPPSEARYFLWVASASE
jgi:hypothetical protein